MSKNLVPNTPILNDNWESLGIQLIPSSRPVLLVCNRNDPSWLTAAIYVTKEAIILKFILSQLRSILEHLVLYENAKW